MILLSGPAPAIKSLTFVCVCFFQFVPLIVDMCTQIVEAKGLEMTGVYRIPGNKAAVTLLQEEFNKVCKVHVQIEQ